MNPELSLGVVTALAGFVLKTTLAFGVCLALSWLAASPGRRFLIWASFLYGMAGYWFWVAKCVLVGAPLSASEPRFMAHQVMPQTLTSIVSTWQLPGSWAFPLDVALRVLGIAYVLVLSYMLLTHIRRLRQLEWILGFTSQPPDEVAAAFQPLAENLHVGRSRLKVLSGATSPATFGWIRPTIVLPDVCLEQDPSELEDILRHELHHVRRWDFVWNGFAVICRALLFFHPAAWYAVRRMEIDRELACDLAVVSDSPKGRAKYAECLIHFARLNSAQDSRNWGIDFAASSEQLKTRVHSILAGSQKASPWLVGFRAACGLALLAGFLGIEPSLGVLLTYARQQVSQPMTAEFRTADTRIGTGTRATKRGRLPKTSIPTTADATVASLSQATQPTGFPAERKTDGSPAAQSSVGPQLLHRGSPAAGNSTKQQTVALTDSDASGQSSKTGDHDGKQVLQQSVTAAAGIYRRLSGLDRR